MRIFCHFSIICTKGRCDMYDTCSIVSGNIIAQNHSESFTFHFNKVIFIVFCHKYFVWVSLRIVGDEWCSIAVHFFRRFYPRHKLLVMKSFEFLSLVVIDHLVGYYFVSLAKSRQVDTLCHFALCGKICTHSFVRHDDIYWLGRIWIVSLYRNIIELWTHTQCCIRRKCPWCGSPCDEIGISP